MRPKGGTPYPDQAFKSFQSAEKAGYNAFLRGKEEEYERISAERQARLEAYFRGTPARIVARLAAAGVCVSLSYVPGLRTSGWFALVLGLLAGAILLSISALGEIPNLFRLRKMCRKIAGANDTSRRQPD